MLFRTRKYIHVSSGCNIPVADSLKSNSLPHFCDMIG